MLVRTSDVTEKTSYLSVSAQPFALQTADGLLVVDTPFIELYGGSPTKDQWGAVWGALEGSLGTEVVIVGGRIETSKRPRWADAHRMAGGYRGHASANDAQGRVRKLVADARAPLQVWLP